MNTSRIQRLSFNFEILENVSTRAKHQKLTSQSVKKMYKANTHKQPSLQKGKQDSLMSIQCKHNTFMLAKEGLKRTDISNFFQEYGKYLIHY